MMFNVLDILIFILLALGALNGYRQGLLNSVVNLLGSIVALIVSIKYHKAVAQFADEHLQLLNRLRPFLENNIPVPAQVSMLPDNDSGLMLLEIAVREMTIPQFLKVQLIQKAYSMVQLAGQMGIITIGELLIYIIALTLLNGLTFLILWLLIQNILMVVARFFSNTFDTTIIGTLNRLAGIAVGFSVAFISVMIVIGIINIFLEATKTSQAGWLIGLTDVISQSLLVPYFLIGYEIILAKIITFI